MSASTYAARIKTDPVYGSVYRRLEEYCRKGLPTTEDGITLQADGQLIMEGDS